MFKNIRSFFLDMFGKNPNISKKPLTKLSIFFVVVFDIFLLSHIFQGYEYQGNIITRPYDYNKCITLFRGVDNINHQTFINSLNRYYSFRDNIKYSDECNQVHDLFTKELDNSVSNYISDLNKINVSINALNNDIRRYEIEYGKYLGENIAGISSYDDRLSGVSHGQTREEYLRLTSELKDLENQIISLTNNFVQDNKDYKNLISFLDSNKEEFINSFDKSIFWYPVKVAFFQAILLFPLFLVSLFLYKFYLKRQNKIFTILFSNLTFLSGIFIFILLFKFLYFLLPKKIFLNLILFLQNLNLGFLWNYLLIFIGILIFGGIIYLSQKGAEKLNKIKEENDRLRLIENRQKITKERFFAGKCLDCESVLLPDSRFCSNCGYDQLYKCNKCGELNSKAFDYCKSCGNKNKDNSNLDNIK